MTGLPAPVPLPDPAGDPAAVEELHEAVTGAAFRLGVLTAHLAGPAARAPGWLGADAAAVALQVVRIARLTEEVHEALTGAARRLAAHGEVLRETRRRIRVLRAEQEDDFAVARARLAWGGRSATGVPDLTAREDLAAGEARRRREHGRLLVEVSADAAATATVLAGATTVVGGSGRPGDRDRVLAHLAAELPGWGDREMAARGATLARELGGQLTQEERLALARDAGVFADSAAFAAAFLTALGVDGLRFLLVGLGLAGVTASGAGGAGPGLPTSDADPLAALIARSFRAAGPGGGAPPPLREVLLAEYVDPHDPDSMPDDVAAGMSAVLQVAALPLGTVALWGRQFLDRERIQGRPVTHGRDPLLPDPADLAVRRMVSGGDPQAAATLLATPLAWGAALARSWADAGQALAAAVALAGRAPGPAGAEALASGLQALGEGLSPARPLPWTVDRTTAGALAPALADGLAGHGDLLRERLGAAAAEERWSQQDDEALRGLGYLTVDRAAADVLRQALATGQPGGSAAALGGFVALEEYGQRLAHALDAAEARSDAVDRQLLWNISVGLPSAAVTGPAAVVVPVVERLAAHALHADGSWDAGPDTGLSFTARDAETAALVALGPADDAVRRAAVDEAGRSFERVLAGLGIPQAPEPFDPSWSDVLADATAQLAIERLTRGLGAPR